MHQTKKIVLLLAWVVMLTQAPLVHGDDSTGSVTLSLDDYLQLVERIEHVAQERQAPSESVVAELTVQKTRITIDGPIAEIEASYQVELRGRSTQPVVLPVTGLVEAARVEPSLQEGVASVDVALHRKAGELLLVATEPGTYMVEVRGRAELHVDDGVSRLKLAESRAGVATLDLDLPADLSWKGDGVVVIEDRLHGARRQLRLAPTLGKRALFELRRDAAGATQEQTRARAEVVTVVRHGARGIERHDVVLYEITRGELSRFTIDLPSLPPEAGEFDDLYPIERSATDEGVVFPVIEAGRLTVERQRRLSARGHLVLSFVPRLPILSELPLPPIQPAVPVRSRYLVLVSDRAGEVEPQPAEAWNRVDVEDLPRGARREIAGLGPSSVWRRTEATAEPRLRTVLYEPVGMLPAVVERRSTTTLWTVEGSLVHRDVFDLQRADTSFELSLPPGATLWSVSVDGQAVRPIERGSTIVVPLAFKTEGATQVELVTVEERTVARGTSRLGVELARIAVPVLEHQWRLLLPEQHRYQLGASDLALTSLDSRTTGLSTTWPRASVIDSSQGSSSITGTVVDDSGAALPGVVITADIPTGGTRTAYSNGDGRFDVRGLAPGSYRIAVNLDGFQPLQLQASVFAGHTTRLELEMQLAQVVEEIVVTSQMPAISLQNTAVYGGQGDRREQRRKQEAAELELESFQQGLVGGVKPLAVEIPESGKLMLLVGALPPPDVGVELEVKAKR